MEALPFSAILHRYRSAHQNRPVKLCAKGPMGKDLTLSDVAKAAGVSLAAASRALNGKDGVRPDVRERVQLVADGLGYRPNRAAQNLAGGRASVVGLLLGAEYLHGDVYAASLLQAFINAADQRDEGLMLIGDSRSPSDTVRDLIRDGMIDGVVISAVASGHEWAEELLDAKLPTVLVGAHPRRSDTGVIDVENRDSTSRLVGRMLETGRERIALLAGPRDRVDAELRRDGYHLAHTARGLTAHPELEFQGDFAKRSGYSLADEVLAAKPDAVFCANDEMALGLFMALTERGVQVPRDLCLAGFDRTAAIQFGNPKLTSVKQPFAQLAEQAMDALADLLDGATPTDRTIEPDIYWGETTLTDHHQEVTHDLQPTMARLTDRSANEPTLRTKPATS